MIRLALPWIFFIYFLILPSWNNHPLHSRICWIQNLWPGELSTKPATRCCVVGTGGLRFGSGPILCLLRIGDLRRCGVVERIWFLAKVAHFWQREVFREWVAFVYLFFFIWGENLGDSKLHVFRHHFHRSSLGSSRVRASSMTPF